MAISELPGCFPESGFDGPYDGPGELPLGEWHILANGRIHILDITAISGGVVTATFSSGDINADPNALPSWDVAESRLTFTRRLEGVGPNNAGTWQPFTGYLLQFHCDPKQPETDCDPKRRIAGTYETQDNNRNPLFSTSGWYATIPNPDKR